MEVLDDVVNFAVYIKRHFASQQAVDNLYAAYEKQVKSLATFPTGYRGISIEYRGYEIRMKPFGTYNIFFIVDEQNQRVVILRLLKDVQDWSQLLRLDMEYHIERYGK
jgi:plasmid stabilization system protein ParE